SANLHSIVHQTDGHLVDGLPYEPNEAHSGAARWPCTDRPMKKVVDPVRQGAQLLSGHRREPVIGSLAVQSEIDGHSGGQKRAPEFVRSPCESHVELRLTPLRLGDCLRMVERVREDRPQGSGPAPGW